MDRDTLLNWIGDPQGSTMEWVLDNLAGLGRHGRTVTVPDLNGVFMAEARRRLTRAGLRMKVIEPLGPGTGQTVAFQKPAAGQSVRRGTTVTVSVESSGHTSIALLPRQTHSCRMAS